MYRIKITLLFSILFLFESVSGFSQSKILSKNAEISVLTCDSGSELYSLYGHTALRIKDQTNAIDKVYNFGYFDFRTPNFYMKFIKGNLQYFAATDSFEGFMTEYVYDQRGVYEQKLNLDASQKQKIFEELEAVLASDERFYTYMFIDKNCTTMVADVINNAITEKLSTKITDSDKSYRKILYGYQEKHFFENLGINILFGAKTDTNFDHPFLPLQLLESVKKSKNNNVPLSNQVVVLNIQSAPEVPFSFWNSFYPYVLFFLIITLLNNQTVTLSYLFTAGLLGIFLLSVGLFSSHRELALNYNVLLFNPLFILLVYLSLKKNIKWVQISSYCCAGFLVVYLLWMINKVNFLLFLPIVFAHFVLIWRTLKNHRKNSLLAAVK